MALVLTRKAGESIRISEADKPTFSVTVLEVRPNGVYIGMTHGKLYGDVHVNFEDSQALFGGTMTFYKGFRTANQTRVVFEMPRTVNIARSELLK